MKKTLIALTIILALGSAVSSCKKGENDPFLSLKSRKARFVGEWKVISSITTDVESDGDKTTTTSDGSLVTQVDFDATSGVSNTSTYTQSEDWTFNKDNTFTYKATTIGGVTQYEGTWAFIGKSKDSDIKKKENVGLNITKFTETPTVGVVSSATYEGDQGFLIIFELDQLKGKEIIIKNSIENTDISSFGGSSTTDKYSSNTTTTLQLK